MGPHHNRLSGIPDSYWPLEKDLRDAQIKNAQFAAAKLAKKLYEARKKLKGEDDPMTVAARQQLVFCSIDGAMLKYTELRHSPLRVTGIVPFRGDREMYDPGQAHVSWEYTNGLTESGRVALSADCPK